MIQKGTVTSWIFISQTSNEYYQEAVAGIGIHMTFLLEATLELDPEKRTDGKKPQISTLLHNLLDNHIRYIYDITTPFISHVPL